MKEKFQVSALIPLEGPKPARLTDLKRFLGEHGSFDGLERWDPMTVDVDGDGLQYIAGGNHRTFLLAQGGATHIEAEARIIPAGDAREEVYSRLRNRLKDRGMSSIADMLKDVW